MKKWICLFGLLVCIPVFFKLSEIHSQNKLIDCYNSVGAVINVDENYTAGTVFVVQSKKIDENTYLNVALGCAHVFFNIQEPVIRMPTYNKWGLINYSESKGYIYDYDVMSDLAVVTFLSNHAIPEMALDLDYFPEIGSDAFKIACGGDEEWRLDYGKITATSISKIFNGIPRTVYRTSIFTMKGDSGAPTINDNFAVFGMLNALKTKNNTTGDTYDHVSYSMPISGIKTWDERINNELEFIWNKSKPIPVLPFQMLIIERAEETRAVPSTFWEFVGLTKG